MPRARMVQACRQRSHFSGSGDQRQAVCGDPSRREPGRGAGQGAVSGYQVMKTAFDIHRKILQELVVHPVNEGFVNAAVGGVWDVILDGVDGIAAAAQICPVELGIVDIAREAGKLPEDDACIMAVWVVEMINELAKLVTTDRGGSGGGDIGKDGGEYQIILDAPVLDEDLLLGNGEILILATRIAQVSHHAGVEGEGCFRH